MSSQSTASPAPCPRIVLIGDTVGLPLLLRVVPPGSAVAIVAAQNRPFGHAELAQLAGRDDLPLLIQPPTRSPDRAAFAERLRRLEPDLLLCNSYSQLLPAEVLALPTIGALNLHGGRLPEYRGANPIQWALLEGERSVGVSLHVMTEQVDQGPLVASAELEIGLGDTWATLLEQQQQAAELLLRAALPPILATGRVRACPQDEARARTWPRRTPEDGRIDWSWPIWKIHNLIRALVAPLPGAFYETADGQRVILDQYLTLQQVTDLVATHRPSVLSAP